MSGRRALAAVAAGVLGLLPVALAGCGEIAPDDFEVLRSGQGPGANLDLVVRDDGYARCNRGPELQMTDSELVDARGLQMELDPDATSHVQLAPRPGGEFNYTVKMQDGQLSWGDTSMGVKSTYQQIAELAHQIATGVCHLPV